MSDLPSKVRGEGVKCHPRCELCSETLATQRRYPKTYRREEFGTPLCDRCAKIWDEETERGWKE